MGVFDEFDPFAEEVAPLEQLEAEAELLRLVAYWRTQYERVADDYARLEDHKRRIYLAKRAKAAK